VNTVHVVVPGDVDDPEVPSGGNTYDRRVCRALPDAGWAVREHAVAGTWPHPDPAARAALAAVLAAVPDDATVLVDGLVACGVPDVVVPQAHRVRLVVLVHLPLGDEVGAASGLAELERETLHAASAVVATSPWAARRLAAAHGLGHDRIAVATPGVDPAPPAAGTDDAGRLLCVGSITPTKGQDLLVAALAAIAELPWHCDLVGPVRRDPAHVAAVRDAVQRHGLGERVRLVGPYTGERLAAAYAAADLLVVPSRTEAYGMVVTEALARAVPVLATAVGGVLQAVGHAPDGQLPGMLVRRADPSALAAALHRWLTDAALRTHLRRAAVARRETLDGWDETARRLAEVLGRLPCVAS
jgi:glycosyltransferase involved in cell wall biosynthesis